MNPYAVKLFWNEPDGSPNMMICSVVGINLRDAIDHAIEHLEKRHHVVDPIRIEAELDAVKVLLARTSGSPSSTAE